MFLVTKYSSDLFTSKKQEDIISRGFSQLSLATLYELFKSQLAGREAARQRLVTTTWELEASERYTTFLNRLQHENKDRLITSDEELQRIRNVFSDRSPDLDDDINYLQAVYDDDCEILRAVAAQANVLKRHLGSRVKQDVLLGSMGESSHPPQFVGIAPGGTDDSMDDDGDSGDDDDHDDHDSD
jgi:hypothetical protein